MTAPTVHHFAGTLATAGVLVVGLMAFKHGNSKLSQQASMHANFNERVSKSFNLTNHSQCNPLPLGQMMRARIVAQGATVAIMLGASVSAVNQLRQNSTE